MSYYFHSHNKVTELQNNDYSSEPQLCYKSIFFTAEQLNWTEQLHSNNVYH